MSLLPLFTLAITSLQLPLARYLPTYLSVIFKLRKRKKKGTFIYRGKAKILLWVAVSIIEKVLLVL